MAFTEVMTRMRDSSFVRTMTADPEAKQNYPNQTKRQVKSGHYVPVPPTPLPDPAMVLYSPEMAQELGFKEEHCQSAEFTRFFSGDVAVVPDSETWATPYALSIYGTFQQNGQCPFGNGNGYGDGRAISIQEMVSPSGQRWELQLKGAGGTPFRRTGDGRAVLRSSIREFLASEAMEHMGVPTTRALSLVVSRSESTVRPKPESDAGRQMQQEPVAITCRVAPSFLRIGHFELFARRFERLGGMYAPGTSVEAHSLSKAEINGARGKVTGRQNDRIQIEFGEPHGNKALKPSNLKIVVEGPSHEALKQLEMLVNHALERECGGVPAGSSTADKVWALLRHTAQAVAHMTAEWLRVGFCQGNFNADNCLISGRTMDYGPFGYVEEFDPLFGSWTGSGRHFAFMNQPTAGLMNLRTLAESLAPLLGEDEDVTFESVKAIYLQASESAKAEVWRKKLGLSDWSSEAAEVLSELLRLMQNCKTDYTITWRQLAEVLALPPGSDDQVLLRELVNANGHTRCIEARADAWTKWLRQWLALVDRGHSREAAATMIKSVSPKYVPREWMLKEVYDAAQQGDMSGVKELFEVLKHPFDEQPTSQRYFVCKPRVSIS